jgi:hypothetical protein
MNEKSLRHVFGVIVAAALGTANALLPRVLLGGESYRIVLLRFAIWVLPPVILLGFVGSRILPPSHFNVIISRGALVLTFIGLFASSIAFIALWAHVMISTGIRECIGIVCFFGVGATTSAVRTLGSLQRNHSS